MREKNVSTIELNFGRDSRFFLSGDAWVNEPEPIAGGQLGHSWHRRWSYSFEYDDSDVRAPFGLLVTMNGRNDAAVTLRVGNTDGDRRSHLLFEAYLANKEWIKSRGITPRISQPSFLKSDWDAFRGPYPLGMSLVDIRGVERFGSVSAGYGDPPNLCVAFVHNLIVKEVLVQCGVGESATTLFSSRF